MKKAVRRTRSIGNSREEAGRRGAIKVSIT